MEIGFITVASEGKNYAITEIDFQIYQFGENLTATKDYAFSFKAANRKEYFVKVQAHSSPEFYIGVEAESRIVEQLCNFEVNGIPGWGAAEWQYRNLKGLPTQ